MATVDVISMANDHRDANVDSDEDVIHVPYVKPPPPVIDLLLTSDDEASTVGEESSNKSETKKSRKRKRSNNYETDDIDYKLGSDSASNSEQRPHNETPPLPVTPSAVNAERIIIHAVTTIKQVNASEGQPCTFVNAEPTVSMHIQTLNNIGTSCSLSTIDNSSHQSPALPSEDESLPSIHVASSIFESDSDKEVLEDPISSVIMNEAGPEIIENVPIKTVEVVHGSSSDTCSTAAVDGDGQARKWKRNVFLPLATTDTAISTATPPLPQIKLSRKQIAKQRTSDEIRNFLTSLGLLKPNETISDPNPKRKSPQRDTLAIAPLPLDAVQLSVDPVVTPFSESAVDPVNAPITEAPSTPAVPVSQMAKKAKTEKPQHYNKPKQTATVLPPIIAQMGTTGDNSSLSRSRVVSMNQDFGILSRTERAGLSFNISSILDPPPTTETGPTSKAPVFKNPLAVSTLGTDSNLQKSSKARVTDTNLQAPRSTKSTKVRQPEAGPSYLPSKWTPQMVNYYDRTSNKNMNSTKILSKMSDNPTLWKTNEWKFPQPAQPETNNRIRCFNCHEFGHMRKNCMEKRRRIVCHCCGEDGHIQPGRGKLHLDIRYDKCPNAVCLNCGGKQPKASTHGCHRCTNKPRRCGMCDIEGHGAFNCPDNWRKFFSTTKPITDGTQQFYGDKPVYRSRRNSYCSNCGQKGHNYFHCRFKGDSIERKQNPRIFDELPQFGNGEQIRPATVGSHNSTFTAGDFSKSSTLSGSNLIFQSGEAKKCMDPECQNTLLSNTFCFEMSIKSRDHKLIQKTQENTIKALMKPQDQLSILQNRNAIHITSDDIIQCKSDALKVIAKLSSEARKQPVADINIKAAEVITLDDSDEDASETVTITLLKSEWDLLFSETKNEDWLINQLTKKLKVNFHMTKDNFKLTIEKGTDKTRKLARESVQLWLQCRTTNTKYVMDLDSGNATPQKKPALSTPSKKHKRSEHSPKSPSIPSPKLKKQKLEGSLNKKSRWGPVQNPSATLQENLPNPWYRNSNHGPQSQTPYHNSGNKNQSDAWRRYLQHPFLPNGQQTPFANSANGLLPTPPTQFHPSFNYLLQQQNFQWPPQNYNGLGFNFGNDNSGNRSGSAAGNSNQRNGPGRN